MFETPEQKVARLRAAHERAKAAKVSKFDKVVDASRKVFDSAHKVTVAGLIGFTVLAGLVTAYTAVDMIMYNKKRSAEWAEAQMKLEADSLEAARIAYMTGKADEEQIALVEEQLERERVSGRKTSFFKDMSTNNHNNNNNNNKNKTHPSSPGSPPTSNAKKTPTPTPTPPPAPSAPMSPQSRLGYESLSDDDGAAGGAVRDSDLARAVERRQATLQAKAAAALERERENQRRGGLLDRVGVVEEEEGGKGKDGAGEGGDGKGIGGGAVGEGEKKKKGWWW
ncbi:hypothetical protein CHGG_08790 [Chaetomium globosum CBS 148.51]|uniref:Uncharacterized protein n=1 Tax=Chaetomium globosum (strain ATCC 6205 / CBS 148.51 / DSM 1962 / NBRC 6347 / NRRL 1970) TaxID=306901 RepID=Q2GTB4_CHAGB|nr:uncharacterized protein CHGG_08790 [Chaetomium globosum CBS 148.51]EAQ84776.1 hypothetical protein CHGG_08790 [Chaetomium globosum CBS 148.51]